MKNETSSQNNIETRTDPEDERITALAQKATSARDALFLLMSQRRDEPKTQQYGYGATMKRDDRDAITVFAKEPPITSFFFWDQTIQKTKKRLSTVRTISTMAKSRRIPLQQLLCVLLAVTTLLPAAQGFTGALRSRAKQALLEKVVAGAPESEVLGALQNVERLSLLQPGSARLDNPKLGGNWLMVWTTSASIAGKSRPKFLQTPTPPEQFLDVTNGKAVNAERVLFGIRNAVEAEITPATANKVRVQFKKFKIGPLLAFDAPEKFKGELSVTYLDDDMRISRGDLGNAFILLRESNSREEANRIWQEWRKSWKP